MGALSQDANLVFYKLSLADLLFYLIPYKRCSNPYTGLDRP